MVFEITGIDALKNAAANRVNRGYPGAGDLRSRFGGIFPSMKPKNGSFGKDLRVFTIGSCFARNIEEHLGALGLDVPTSSFSVPENEWKHRPNGLLNEYTPGTMSQRIIRAIQGVEAAAETVIPDGTSGFVDLLLPGGAPVSYQRAFERRAEIGRIYARLIESDVVIITLGYVEAWYDAQTATYINRMPPHAAIRAEPDRYRFRRLNVKESLDLLDPAIRSLTDRGIRVVLTVSPVPIAVTFTADDCTIANEYSKATLRIVAEELRSNPLVDYFPSYEIVRSMGLAVLHEDQVHVKSAAVGRVVAYMLETFGVIDGNSN